MNLRERINEEMKVAMKAKETAKLATIRLLLSAVRQKEIDERITLDDAGVIAVVEKLTKQRKDSVTQYSAAGRTDLAEVEQFEISVLATYLPEKMGADELAAVVDAAIAEIGVGGTKLAPSDMGKLMAVLKPRLAGKADMAEVSKLVKSRLQ